MIPTSTAITESEDHSRPDDQNMKLLAEAVNDSNSLTLEEAGAAEELLALASEASLSSPIHRADSVFTPLPPASSLSHEQSTANTTSAIQTHFPAQSSRHSCHNCGVTSTPFWRKAPDGYYYCNACGLYLRTHKSQRPTSLSQNRESRRNKLRPELCGNCGATETPMWRKSGDGQTVCNACGLYWKLHGCHRRIAEGAVKRRAPRESRKKENAEPGNHSISSQSAKKAPRYSLDSSTFHYTFSGNSHQTSNANQNTSLTSNQNSIPALPTMPPPPQYLPQQSAQVIDQRKLAYLKHANGRSSAPIAPKLTPSSSSPSPMPQLLSPNASALVPPILSTIIQSLASSPTESLAQMDSHPLQPLITTIVSQKLAQHKRSSAGPSPAMISQENDPFSANVPSSNNNNNSSNNQAVFPVPMHHHLQYFDQDLSTHPNPHHHLPFLPRTQTNSPLYLNVDQQPDFLGNSVLPRPPSTSSFLPRGQSPMTTLMNKDLHDFVDFQFWADQGRME